MERRTYHIRTFGCAMNGYDSERIASALEKKGLLPALCPEEADVLIFNTCSVREKPQSKISSYLGRVKEYKTDNPGMIVGIAGCVAQQEGAGLLKNKTVDFVVGTEAVARMDEILDRAFSGERFADIAWNSGDFSIGDFTRRRSVSAGVTIMKGCENFCSYCIVPYVRGREVSRSPEEIIGEIERLADMGVKEVCLLGQNVNSYGANLADGTDFSSLLKRANRIDGIKRIRFMTSHPKDFTDRMINAIAECEKVCKHVHLPLQAGSDSVLLSMNRGYTYAGYAERVEAARKLMPEMGLSSDFITGFPGETEEDFEKTLNAVRYMQYDQIYAFNYSKRPGTAAEKLDDDVPAEVKSERLSRLFEAYYETLDAKLAKTVGTERIVLITGRSKKDRRVFTGCDEINRTVNFIPGREAADGDLTKVRITEAKRHSLFGAEVALCS